MHISKRSEETVRHRGVDFACVNRIATHGQGSDRAGPARRLLWMGALAILGLVGTGVVTTGVASAGVVITGDDWFDGDGVPVCYPASGSCPGVENVGGVAAAPWQCVELAQRFYEAQGWHSGIFSGVSYAYEIFSSASSNGMTAHPNGSGYVPVPGDLIVHDSTIDGAGHVAIIDTVNGNTVSAIEQNVSSTGRATYTLAGSSLSRAGMGGIVGVVHDPDNSGGGGGGVTNGNGGEMLLYRPTDGYRRLLDLTTGGARDLWPQGFLSPTPTDVVAVDIDGDGTEELVQYNETTGWRQAFEVNPGSTSAANRPLWPAGAWTTGLNLTAADVDGG